MKRFNDAMADRTKGVGKGAMLLGGFSTGMLCLTLGRLLRHAWYTADETPPDGIDPQSVGDQPGMTVAPEMRDPLFATQAYLASALRRLQNPAPDKKEVADAIRASIDCLKKLEAMQLRRSEARDQGSRNFHRQV